MDLWNISSLEPFMPEINKILEKKLPIVNANPDYIANMGTETGGTIFAIRNGTFAKYLIDNGIDDYLEFGKPHRNTYDFVLNYLKLQDVNIDKNRTCMVGDTLRTDIRGAVDSGIKGVLCYETGVTAEQMRQGKTYEELVKEEKNIKVDYIIKSVSGMI
jgi:ribonucleotide monophosphatase NagD (HAD superfamily)